MRKALIVGIDHYVSISGLHGCVSDAHDVKAALERHADGTLNFANPQRSSTSLDTASSTTPAGSCVQAIPSTGMTAFRWPT